MQIRTHKYAETAYPLVEAVKGQDIEKKYRTLALNFPTMIMQSGLAQAIGFLMAKGKNNKTKEERAYFTLLEHISTLLRYGDSKKFHEEILSSNITQYQLLTRQAIEASAWLKRYTQALLDKTGGQS